MKFFKYLFSSLFAIILWGIVIGFIAFLSVRSFISKKSISDMIKSVKINELIVDKDGNYTKTGREIRNELTKNGIPEELVDEFLDAEPIVDFIADYTSGVVDYIIYDSEFDKIKAKDIADLINNNVDDIFVDLRNRKVEGYELLTDDVLNEIKSNVNSISDEVEKSLPDIKKELKLEEGQEVLNAIRLALSNTTVLILIGIVAFFSLLIILLNLKKCRFGYWIGITYMLASLPFVFLSTLPSNIDVSSDIKFSKDLIKYILNRFSLFGLIFFGIGFIFLIIGIIGGLKKNKKSNKDYISSNQKSAESQPSIETTLVEPQPIVDDKPIEPEIVISESDDLENNAIDNESVNENYSYCASCGARLEPNQKFCYNCGTSKE